MIHFKAKDITKLPALDSLKRTVLGNKVFGVLPFRAYKQLLSGSVTTCTEIPKELKGLVEVIKPDTNKSESAKTTKTTTSKKTK